MGARGAALVALAASGADLALAAGFPLGAAGRRRVGRGRGRRAARGRRVLLSLRRAPGRAAAPRAPRLMGPVEGLVYGFGVALAPANLLACFVGVLIGT